MTGCPVPYVNATMNPTHPSVHVDGDSDDGLQHNTVPAGILHRFASQTSLGLFLVRVSCALV